MSDLLPCPFCGGEPMEFRFPGYSKLWCIECKNCDAGPSACLRLEDAQTRWNTRVSNTPQAQMMGLTNGVYSLDDAGDIGEFSFRLRLIERVTEALRPVDEAVPVPAAPAIPLNVRDGSNLFTLVFEEETESWVMRPFDAHATSIAQRLRAGKASTEPQMRGNFLDVVGIREQKLATIVAPDNGTPAEVLAAVFECALAWVPEARIIGNVRAGDIARVLAHIVSETSPPPGSQIRTAECDGKDALTDICTSCETRINEEGSP